MKTTPATETEYLSDGAAENADATEQHVAFLAKYVFCPGAFLHDILSVQNPDPWQLNALDLLLARRFVAVRSGNGPGKTALLAWAILWFLITRPMSVVPCTAITKTQLDSTLWAELFRWISGSRYLSKRLRWTHEEVQVIGFEAAWFAKARTAVNSHGEVTEGLQGTHAPYILFIVDEASGVPDKAIDALESATTDINSFGLMAGNPTRRSGTFFRAFHQDRDVWCGMHIRPENSSRISPDFIRRMRRKYGGENTNGYRIRVAGEFPTADATGLLSFEDYNHPDVQIRKNPPPVLFGECVLSVDPAGSSPEADASTIGIRVGCVVPAILTFHGLKEVELAEQIRRVVEKYHPASVVVDSIGIGAATATLLEEQYSSDFSSNPRIIRLNVGVSATNSVDFFNKRSELYWHAADAIKRKTIQILEDIPLLETDLTELHVGYTSKRKFQIETKDTFRERNDGRSTDYGDAFSLLFYEEAAEHAVKEEMFLGVKSALAVFKDCGELTRSSRWRPEMEEVL